MIWGLTLEPGKQYTRIMGDEIQLSMASLETREEFGSKCNPPYTQVILTTKRSEYLLCTLAHGTAFQQNLDLRLRPSETVTFSVQGKNVVYLMGYSTSDSEISDSIEINFEMDDTEDVISEFAESEQASSPVLPDGTAVSGQSHFDTQERNAEMAKDVPSPLRTQDAGERRTEQSKEFPLVESVSIKTEVVDSPPPEMSCHGDNVNPLSQDEPPVPQKLSPATDMEPAITHSQLELPHTSYIVQSNEPTHGSVQNHPQENLAQVYQSSSQSTVIQRYQTETQVSASIIYQDDVQDNLTGRYRGDGHNNIAHRYQGGPAEPVRVIPVGLQSTKYPDQESVERAVYPVGTSDRDDEKSSHHQFMADMNHQTMKVGSHSSSTDPEFMSVVGANDRVLGKNIGPCQSNTSHRPTPIIDQGPMDTRGGMCKCHVYGGHIKSREDWSQHDCATQRWQCKLCHKLLKTRHLLKMHERCHNKERPYSCHICSKAFSRRWNLLRHQKLCHGKRLPKRRKMVT